jgi:hypothetical protein
MRSDNVRNQINEIRKDMFDNFISFNREDILKYVKQKEPGFKEKIENKVEEKLDNEIDTTKDKNKKKEKYEKEFEDNYINTYIKEYENKRDTEEKYEDKQSASPVERIKGDNDYKKYLHQNDILYLLMTEDREKYHPIVLYHKHPTLQSINLTFYYYDKEGKAKMTTVPLNPNRELMLTRIGEETKIIQKILAGKEGAGTIFMRKDDLHYKTLKPTHIPTHIPIEEDIKDNNSSLNSSLNNSYTERENDNESINILDDIKNEKEKNIIEGIIDIQQGIENYKKYDYLNGLNYLNDLNDRINTLASDINEWFRKEGSVASVDERTLKIIEEFYKNIHEKNRNKNIYELIKQVNKINDLIFEYEAVNLVQSEKDKEDKVRKIVSAIKELDSKVLKYKGEGSPFHDYWNDDKEFKDLIKDVKTKIKDFLMTNNTSDEHKKIINKFYSGKDDMKEYEKNLLNSLLAVNKIITQGKINENELLYGVKTLNAVLSKYEEEILKNGDEIKLLNDLTEYVNKKLRNLLKIKDLKSEVIKEICKVYNRNNYETDDLELKVLYKIKNVYTSISKTSKTDEQNLIKEDPSSAIMKLNSNIADNKNKKDYKYNELLHDLIRDLTKEIKEYQKYNEIDDLGKEEINRFKEVTNEAIDSQTIQISYDNISANSITGDGDCGVRSWLDCNGESEHAQKYSEEEYTDAEARNSESKKRINEVRQK